MLTVGVFKKDNSSLDICWIKLSYMSESDTLGPIDNFSDTEMLVSFERDMFADYSFKNKMKIFPNFHVYITTLKYMPKA